MYYEWYKKYHKTILFCFLGLMVLCICYATVTYISRIGKTGVTISAVPSDATITLNGSSVNNGTAWLTPGTYTVIVSKSGFSERKKTFTVPTQNTIAMALTPQSDTAKKWAANNTDLYENNQYYGAIEASQSGEAFEDKHPIVKLLPYNDPYFQINYTRNSNDTITLTIATPSPRYRYYALQKIRDYGYNPDDFVIEFSDFVNPLGDAS